MSEISTRESPRAQGDKPALWLWLQVIFDSLSWAIAIAFAYLALNLRYDFASGPVGPPGAAPMPNPEVLPDFASFVPGYFLYLAVAIIAQFAVGYGFALYRGRYSFGSFQEAKLLVAVVILVSVVLFVFGLIVGPLTTPQLPRSIAVVAFPFACIFMAASRYLKRTWVELKNGPGESAVPAVVYGAGFVGDSLVSRMARDTNSPYRPVALIDDDPAKKHLRISSVPVRGGFTDIPDVVRRTGAKALIVAINNVDSAKIREIAELVDGLGVRVLVMPPLKDMLGRKSEDFSFRDVAIEDLIGRQPVQIRTDDILTYVQGKRVLVTGAGGSIGSELCRQIVDFKPAELIMVDRDETALQSTQLSITGHGLLDGRDTVLADIRDPEALLDIFSDRKPEVVFHAAALKHVSLLEQYPVEAWKTNVLGSLNVLRAASAAKVETFVNISTDKAANPTTVLGHSKRLAEKLTAFFAFNTEGKYVSVRFGNVLGSRGSVLPLFTEQIRKGGPVTVTDPEATRFFMTIPEACQLVLQAGALGKDGEVLLLDMGDPVRILDVAKQMIAMSGADVDIVFTGLRPGEKLHEELMGEGEIDSRPLHPKISHAQIRVTDPEELELQTWLARQGIEENSAHHPKPHGDGLGAA